MRDRISRTRPAYQLLLANVRCMSRAASPRPFSATSAVRSITRLREFKIARNCCGPVTTRYRKAASADEACLLASWTLPPALRSSGQGSASGHRRCADAHAFKVSPHGAKSCCLRKRIVARLSRAVRLMVLWLPGAPRIYFRSRRSEHLLGEPYVAKSSSTTASGWVIIESWGAARSTHFHPDHDLTSWRESSSTGWDGWVECMYVRGRLLPTGPLNVSAVV